MRVSVISALLALLLVVGFIAAQKEKKAMSMKERWNERYDREMYIYGKAPTEFLKTKINALKRGSALVLAMGEGRNAVYLAENGFDVTGVDISEVAIEKCKKLAQERNTTVKTVVADLTNYDLGTAEYDLVTNFYYYDPSIFPKVIEALKPGGIFIFQQFSVDHLKYREKSGFGPRTLDYLVKPNELLTHFKSLRILYYEDTVVELDKGMHKGTAALVRLIAQKSDLSVINLVE